MKLLALDTASELCSAALWLEGRLHWREIPAPRAHAALILPMIDALLAQFNASLTGMDAIAFGRGPGAFTGVRLAVAIAQGLGFAAQRPLIGVSDLRAIAAQALSLTPGARRVLVCQDARMGEVYWGCFEQRDWNEDEAQGHTQGDADGDANRPLVAVGAERVGPAASVELPVGWSQLVAAGPGFAAYPELLPRLPTGVLAVLPRLQPRAQEIARLAARDGLAAAVPAEQALPVYLRDRVATIPPGPVSRGLPPVS